MRTPLRKSQANISDNRIKNPLKIIGLPHKANEQYGVKNGAVNLDQHFYCELCM